MQLTPEMLRNPHVVYAAMRETKVLHFPPVNAWMVFDHDTVKRALTDTETFSSAASAGRPGKWLLFSDPPRHTHLRALITRAFTGRAVISLEPRVRELSRTLLDAALTRETFDLVSDYSLPLPLMVIAELLGAPATDWPTFRRWSDVILGLIHTLGGGDAGARAERAYGLVSGEMDDYLKALLDLRREAPEDDLLTRLLHAEVDGATLTYDDIRGFFELLLLAGHETTTNLISNAVVCLAEHPAELARLRVSPKSMGDLLPTAIEEVLRYRSPVQAMFRIPRRSIALHDHVIGEGQLMLLLIGAANRDPKHFVDPDRFDVGRTPNPHVAFGHGIHFCVGAPLARLEAKVALGDLLARLGDFELVTPEWKPREAFHVHGPSELPIRVAPDRRA